MKNRPLAPGFLKKLDEKWMKQHPILWSSRIHWVLYYGMLALIPVIAIAIPVYFPIGSQHSKWNGSILISVISLICIVYWLRYLFRFNPFKRFSISGPADTLKVFALYFLTFCFFFSWMLIPVFMSYLGTKLVYSKKEIIADMKLLNESVAGEVYHSNPDYYQLEKETIIISRKDSFQVNYRGGREVQDTVTFDEQLYNLTQKSDSVSRLNDTTFIAFTFPGFNFLDSYNYYNDGYSHPGKLELYHKITAAPKSYEEYHATVTRLIDKYLVIHLTSYWGYNNVDYRGTEDKYKIIENSYRDKYTLGIVSHNMDYIKNKLDFEDDLGIYWRLIYYFSMAGALLLFIFRHSSLKALFLSLLTAFILFLVTMVLFLAIGFHDKEPLVIYLFYEIICMICAILIWNARKKNLIYVIGLNIFVFGLTYIPLVLVALLSSSNNENDYFLGCEIAGFIVQLVAIVFVYRPLYRKWYALPEE